MVIEACAIGTGAVIGNHPPGAPTRARLGASTGIEPIKRSPPPPPPSHNSKAGIPYSMRNRWRHTFLIVGGFYSEVALRNEKKRHSAY